MKLVKWLALAVVSATPLAADITSAGALDETVRSTHIFSTVFHDGVDVKSNNGAVTLTGRVLDEYFRTLAEDTARAVPGVTRVDNKLEVMPAPAEQSDAWIRLQLMKRLLLARPIGTAAIQVSVTDGIVTLGGESANLVEKNLAEIYAREIKGVREVKNEIALRAKDAKHRIDDASLKGMVGYALHTHQSTKDLNLEVAVHDAHVTLKGEVPSTLHRNFITLLAETVRSVEKVTANLQSRS